MMEWQLHQSLWNQQQTQRKIYIWSA